VAATLSAVLLLVVTPAVGVATTITVFVHGWDKERRFSTLRREAERMAVPLAESCLVLSLKALVWFWIIDEI
jgi:hypothetical protein